MVNRFMFSMFNLTSSNAARPSKRHVTLRPSEDHGQIWSNLRIAALTPTLACLPLPHPTAAATRCTGMDGAKEAAGKKRPHEGSGYFTFQQRVGVALAMLLVGMNIHGTKQAALDAVWEHLSLGDMPERADKHMDFWFKRLTSTGSVLDAPHPGRPILSDALALEAATILKTGYFLTTRHAGQPDEVKHFWFRSLGEAVRQAPRFAEILRSTGVSLDTLLTRMHHVSPDLKYSRVHMKLALNAGVQAARAACAQWFLDKLAANPNFLNQVVWIDQVKLWLFGGKAEDVHVWHGAHDAGFDACIPCCGSLQSKSIHICLYVAVHAQLGLVFYQYVSGTVKGITRKKWGRLPNAADRQDGDYVVSGACCAFACCLSRSG